MSENWQTGGFGLYVHWPFCKAKCPYCDFNSHVVTTVDHTRWKNAFLAEIDRVFAQTPGRVLSSVFFGGGTPSLMPPDLVGAILERVKSSGPVANDLEVTLEANPTSVEAGRFGGFRDAGVNRVSIGVQALNDTDLRALGRMHTADEARAAFELARATFDRVSLDLIYARQGQSLADWRAELGEALSMASEHLPLYQLTIEAGTAFGDRFARGKLPGLPDEDLAADMYSLTQEMCENAGLPAYEVSNHARPGCESRHNLIYWNFGDYHGIGPGAHGRLTLGTNRYATETPLRPETWLEKVEMSGSGEAKRDKLSPADQLIEFLMMGLRTKDGVSWERLMAFSGSDLIAKKIKGLSDLSLLKSTSDRLIVTSTGRPVLNAVLLELLSDLP